MESKILICEAQFKEELIKLFESGNTDKGKCKEFLRSKYKIQEQRFYKVFNKTVLEWQKAKEEALAIAIQANTINGLESPYMSKIERLECLSKIATGEMLISKPFVINGNIIEHDVKPTATERMNAISEMNKMEGDYAPTKQDLKLNISEGVDSLFIEK